MSVTHWDDVLNSLFSGILWNEFLKEAQFSFGRHVGDEDLNFFFLCTWGRVRVDVTRFWNFGQESLSGRPVSSWNCAVERSRKGGLPKVTSLRILESSLTLIFVLGFYIRSFFSTFPTYIVKFSFARKHRMVPKEKEKERVERYTSIVIAFLQWRSNEEET